MDPKALLDELLRACRGLGLAIRESPMKVPATRIAGGLVRLRGTALVIVDSSAPKVDQIAAVADALCEVAIDPLHLSAEARRALTTARARRRRSIAALRPSRFVTSTGWRMAGPLRSKPGVFRPLVRHNSE